MSPRKHVDPTRAARAPEVLDFEPSSHRVIDGALAIGIGLATPAPPRGM